MSGVAIVGELLRTSDVITGLVPAERIKAGRLPDGIPLPALLVRTVSVSEQHMLRKGATRRATARIAVTVRAANYRDQVMILKAVVTVCADQVGEIAGFANVSILTAGTGPDVSGPADSFEQTQDFRVSFDAAT